MRPQPLQPPRRQANLESHLLGLEPVPTLLTRARNELAAAFDFSKPLRVSRAPGRLDVMGGIADYTGSMVCEATIDRAAAVLLQSRNDRELQIFSFNLLDAHEPFTMRISIDDLHRGDIAQLRENFSAPGRQWAGYLAGCLRILHDENLIDLSNPKIDGLNLALYSTVPIGGGVSSSAAIEVATMMNLVEHFQIRNQLNPLRLAALCQKVENQIVGAPCGIMDQVASCAGEENSMLRMICQPHELLTPLKMPAGFCVIGINSNVKHSVGGGQYGRTRAAAFMGHRMILESMRDLGRAAGRELVADPMRGYLANLDPEDYKSLFRPKLPEKIRGEVFLKKFGGTIDSVTSVEPQVEYFVQSATDHHVLESRRVRKFCEFIEQAGALPIEDESRHTLMDKAGHLMYASHLSYTNDAKLGADECDLLVALVREREKSGLYGAKITGGGSGGTVAILCEVGDRADRAIAEILSQYESKTSRKPEPIFGSSPGAWPSGTVII